MRLWDMLNAFDEEVFSRMEKLGWEPLEDGEYDRLVSEYKFKYPQWAWAFDVAGIQFDANGNVTEIITELPF